MFGNTIIFLSKALNLTLIRRAEEIYRVQLEISNLLQKKDWEFDIKKPFDIDNKEDTIQKLLNMFKKEIKKNTYLKEIPDDYLDNTTSGVVIFGTKKYDNGLIFRYILGRKTQISEFSETFIYNYEELITTLGFPGFMEFIKKIANLLNAHAIEVTDEKLGADFKDFFGNTIEIQIFKNDLLD